MLAMIEPDAAIYSVPSKVLSYLCIGKAIVLSANAANLAALILMRCGAGYVVAPEDEDGIFVTIRRFLDDPEARHRAGVKARAYADENFDIGMIAARFDNFCRIAPGRPPRLKRRRISRVYSDEHYVLLGEFRADPCRPLRRRGPRHAAPGNSRGRAQPCKFHLFLAAGIRQLFVKPDTAGRQDPMGSAAHRLRTRPYQRQLGRARHVFLCHYNEPSVQIAAMLMRMIGKRVIYPLTPNATTGHARSGARR